MVLVSMVWSESFNSLQNLGYAATLLWIVKVGFADGRVV